MVWTRLVPLCCSRDMIATVVWERPLHQRGQMRDVMAAGDRVVTHERGTRFVGLDRADGAVVWDVATGTWPRNVALAGDRYLIMPQSPSQLQCFDLGTGTEQRCSGWTLGRGSHITPRFRVPKRRAAGLLYRFRVR